ncbi:MAG: DUF4294 domain-containing protein [Bergeyella sp.]|nr:DUF4294 domain-containing protein [Bergeyella sp.]
MIFTKILVSLLSFLPLFVFSQRDTAIVKIQDKEGILTDEHGQIYYYDKNKKARVYEVNGESVVILDEMHIVSGSKFNNELDRNYYYFLSRKLNTVYPLFLVALEQYRELSKENKRTDNKYTRKKWMKKKQSELADQYESRLRNLTTSEGQIFAKLMYRATGKTVFEIIDELRGGWSAFWWNVKGNIADVDIKEPYDPYKNRVDEYVEDLLKINWSKGNLTPYRGYKDFKVGH